MYSILLSAAIVGLPHLMDLQASVNPPLEQVLLLTYQRAGSSFTGELLTSGGGGAVYVYEPLFVWRRLLGPEAKAGLEKDSASLLGDLLDCNPQASKGRVRLERVVSGE